MKDPSGLGRCRRYLGALQGGLWAAVDVQWVVWCAVGGGRSSRVSAAAAVVGGRPQRRQRARACGFSVFLRRAGVAMNSRVAETAQ